ncbi:unnamed protein product, partial [Medioppia subpectinata]
MAIKRDRSLCTGSQYHLPLPSGPYPNIGFVDIMTGSDKNDGILVRVLYPALDQTTDIRTRVKEWAKWTPHDNYKAGYLKVVKLPDPLVRLVTSLSTDYFIPILENVDPLRPEGHEFPIIVFSHGLSSCRTTYSSVCTELASHGFIVFVVEHRDESAVTTFYPSSDGSFKWLPYRHVKLYDNDLPIRREQLDLRVTEIKRVIDIINDIQNGNKIQNVLKSEFKMDQLSGLLDLNKIILMGHSFGSSTVIKSLTALDCVPIGVCLDAWMYPVEENESNLVKEPLLFVNMQTFQNKPNLKRMKDYIGINGTNTTDRKVITIKEAKHTDQSDIPFTLPPPLLWLFGMKSKVDPFVAHDLTTGLALDFIADKLKHIMTGSDKNDGILVRVLYPASDQTTDIRTRVKEWAKWTPHDNYKTGYLKAVNLPNPIIRVLTALGSDYFIPILENVDPLQPEGHEFPIIIFSHGNAGCRTSYSSVCTELSSHGFIVFVVEHRDESAVTTFYPSSDGSFKWLPFRHIKLYDNDLPIRREQLDLRVTEIKRVIDLINDIQNGSEIQNVLKSEFKMDQLSGLLDLNKIILMGHSYGSSTVIKSLIALDCVPIGVCLDAWMYPLEENDWSLLEKEPLLFI